MASETNPPAQTRAVSTPAGESRPSAAPVQQPDSSDSSPQHSESTQVATAEGSPTRNSAPKSTPTTSDATVEHDQPHEDIITNVSGTGSTRNEPQAEEAGIRARPNTQWLSWKLEWWYTVIFCLLNLGLIAAIIVLDQLSHRNNGFVKVPDFTDSSLFTKLVHAHKYYSLLWTSLTSFVFTIFGLLWAAIVSAAADRQPFVELRRRGSARRTILLDYRSYPSLYSWCVAFRNKHWHIGLGMTLSLVFTAIAVPLSARLLFTQPAYRTSSLNLSSDSNFNLGAITSQTNLQPFINVADAIHVYGTSPPSWMTKEYAFSRFTIPSENANISMSNTAYSSLVDCRTISEYATSTSSADGTDTVTFQFNDRGCDITKSFGTTPKSNLYSTLWYQRSCSAAYSTRIGLITGLYSTTSPIHLAHFTLLSCIPTYWSTTGTLTISARRSSAPTFVSFTDTNDTKLEPQLQVLFELPLLWYNVFDPSASSVTDAVGFSVYSASLAANNADPIAAMATSSIKAAFENIYATIFASMARSVLLQPLSSISSSSSSPASPASVLSTVTTIQTRLFTTRAIAYTLVAMLLLILACNLLLSVYAYLHPTMLHAEPVGLLGNAVLLKDSADVFSIVERMQTLRPQEADIVEHVKKLCGKGKGEVCWWDDAQGKGQIKVTGVDVQPDADQDGAGEKPWWKRMFRW